MISLARLALTNTVATVLVLCVGSVALEPAYAGGPGTCVPAARYSYGQVIKYRHLNYSYQFPVLTEKAIIAAAFQTWSNILNISFQEVQSGEDLRIRWKQLDPSAKGGFVETVNEIWLNVNKTWSDDGTTDGDLFGIATHEMGHALGFCHTDGLTDVMQSNPLGFTTYRRFLRRQDVQQAGTVYPLTPHKGSLRNGVTAGDFDGDGREDIGLLRNSDGNMFAFTWLPFRFDWIMSERTSNWRPGSGSQWVAAVAADLDGSGTPEFVGLRNYDGDFYAYTVDSQGFHVLASNTDPGPNSAWVNMVAGDFDADGRDEIIAVRNYDGGIYMYEYDGTGKLRLVASNHDLGWKPGSANRWIDLAVGDFDGDGEDEIVAVRQSDGGFYMFEYDGTTKLRRVASNTNAGSAAAWQFLAAGDLDADGRDEVVAIRGYDGSINVYEWNGKAELQLVAYRKFGASSQWRDVTTGDFDGDGTAEIMALRHIDGGLYMLRLSGSTLALVTSRRQGPAWNWTGMTRYGSGGQDCVTVISDYDGNLHLFCYNPTTNNIDWLASG